jgi:hypothetical protein
LGCKLESGLSNASNRLSGSVEGMISEKLTNINQTIDKTSTELNETIREVGIKQAKEIKEIYKREIDIVMNFLMIISISFAVIAFTYFTTLFKNLNLSWNIILLFLFSVLAG